MARRPRVGFLGVGWIGRSRMEAIAATGLVELAAIAEPDEGARAAALLMAPGASVADDLHALLAHDLDGLVIATPSALHAQQSIAALEHGVAVFCQKPLGRDAREVGAVLGAAERADRLLAVDLSYRFAQAAAAVRRAVRSGVLGEVFAADLVFHNAYGPDKAWYRQRALSGGGCVVDLGVHLVDLALWTLDFPAVAEVSSALFAGGRRLPRASQDVEDYALASMTLESGACLRLACSWNLAAGQDAVIQASFWGTQGGAALRNVNGSFFDFEAVRTQGSQTAETLAIPPDAWSGRAAADWARRLAEGGRYDPACREIDHVTRVLDRIVN